MHGASEQDARPSARESNQRRCILGVFAHPDDESMGPGGTLAKCAMQGHRVLFVTATDGGAGRLHESRPSDDAGRRMLKETRRRETESAARILGIEFLGFWDWEDGQLSKRSILEVEERIAATFRREKPDVVITFHGSGISYHPDHRVISMATTAAFLGSGRSDWYLQGEPAGLPPHFVKKLYAYVPLASLPVWKDWPRRIYRADPAEVTAAIDTRETAELKWKAISAHDTQKDGPPFRLLYESGAFEQEFFARIFPTPQPAEARESDLLAGLDE
jgi:N-acetyl-1-D-myo-inositol-2-amino-2-deoxy-alpha-D-glucopyranoside deacetylase/mycothiol S-conjugate amidase